ncbi:hypothetical protein LUZ60_007433 [Juncus effusus]|nr:hypothetical protein LUZ60_007433 [Juncus effusus]
MLVGLDAAAPRFPSLSPRGGNYGCRWLCNIAGIGSGFNFHRNHLRKNCFHEKNLLRIDGDRGVSTVSASDSDESPMEMSRYHPFEDLTDDESDVNGIPVIPSRLPDSQIARTIVEVNNKASLVLSLGDEEDEDFSFPDLPYSTDEHGDIYFEVQNDESLAELADDRIVKVTIGLDSSELIVEQDEMWKSEDFDFEIDLIDSDDESNSDDESDSEDYDSDEVEVEFFIVDDEDQDENMNDWSEFETVNSCHPFDFAKNITEAVMREKIEWTDHPSTGVIIEGLLRPVFSDESSKKNISSKNGEKNAKYENEQNEAAFLKLEVMNIQLNTASGNQSNINVHEYKRAKPDLIAHSASNIISRLKSGGEKIVIALKSLCLRQFGLQVEEACVIGVDSLGFDVKVCSSKQMQVLRFPFDKRATSEFGAEKQVHELLFPKQQQEEGKREERAIGGK